MLLRPVEANAEDARVHNLIHALVELEQDGIQVERSGDLFADFAQQLDAVLLRGDFSGLSANLLGAVVDSGFKRLRLGFERLRLAAGLFRSCLLMRRQAARASSRKTSSRKVITPAWSGTTAAGS